MVLGDGIYLRIGALVYISIWAYFKYRSYRLIHNSPRPNVFEIEKNCEYASIAKSLGWIVSIFVIIICAIILPTVEIVTYASYGKYKIERGVVPFCYKGHFCVPGGEYLINETSQDFVLYSTDFYNGHFSAFNSKYGIRNVPANAFMSWSEGIDNQFEHPTEYSYTYIPDRHKNKSVTEWTIDTKEGAERGRKYVLEIIEKKNKLFFNTSKSSGSERQMLGDTTKIIEFAKRQDSMCARIVLTEKIEKNMKELLRRDSIRINRRKDSITKILNQKADSIKKEILDNNILKRDSDYDSTAIHK